MDYSICKDEHPRQTVKKIKNILNNIGIYTKEKITNFDYTKKNAPRSVRIYVNEYKIGSNGKGSNYINSRASGYAEFMERLQNGFIYAFNLRNKEFLYAPDEIYYGTDELLHSEIIKHYSDKSFVKLLAAINNNNKTVMLPFYSVKEKKEVYLPIEMIQILQQSNGMAAGNTLEEAIVQGLSEICERYSMKYVIKNRIIMPDVPENEYMQYDRIRGMIEYIESLGFKITIKDASLGKNLPVVAAVLEDFKNDKMFIKFGSHPKFPIAVERLITEFLQGVNIDINGENELKNYIMVSGCLENYSQTVFEIFHTHQGCINIKSSLADLFKQNNAKYKYTPSSFLQDFNNNDNKKILKFLLKNIKPLSNDNIYIRDVSYLGFPSIYIYIPSMSILNETNICELKQIQEILNLFESNILKDSTNVDKLLNMTNQYILKYGYNNLYNTFIDLISFRILLLYSILKNDKEMINLYMDLSRCYSLKFSSRQRKIDNIIEDYFKIKESEHNTDKINEQLLKKYNEEDVNYVLKILNLLSINIITDLLNNKFNQFKQEIKSPNQEFEIIRENLIKAYKNNIKNQNNLKNII